MGLSRTPYAGAAALTTKRLTVRGWPAIGRSCLSASLRGFLGRYTGVSENFGVPDIDVPIIRIRLVRVLY